MLKASNETDVVSEASCAHVSTCIDVYRRISLFVAERCISNQFVSRVCKFSRWKWSPYLDPVLKALRRSFDNDEDPLLSSLIFMPDMI